jgi:hypothetical protein
MQTTETVRRPMTLTAIRADKWAAVDLPIPDTADPLLLDQASFAAFNCFNDRQVPAGVAADAWEQRRLSAGERVKELADRLEPLFDALPPREQKELMAAFDHGDAVRAWQQTVFSRETIAADQWTAVYLPIPKHAGRELLEYARGWAADLAAYAARDLAETQGAFAQPSITLPGDAPQPLAAATARLAELDARLGIKPSRWTGEPLGQSPELSQDRRQGQSQ